MFQCVIFMDQHFWRKLFGYVCFYKFDLPKKIFKKVTMNFKENVVEIRLLLQKILIIIIYLSQFGTWYSKFASNLVNVYFCVAKVCTLCTYFIDSETWVACISLRELIGCFSCSKLLLALKRDFENLIQLFFDLIFFHSYSRISTQSIYRSMQKNWTFRTLIIWSKSKWWLC